MPRAGMPRRAGTRFPGKRARREAVCAAGRRYSRLSSRSVERVGRERIGCQATRSSVWRLELQAVPAVRVSRRVCSRGHFRLVTPPTCWSSGAPAQWPLLGRQGGHGGVGGGHWGRGNAIWFCCGAPPGGVVVSAILAGPRAPALGGAPLVVSSPATRPRFPLPGDTPFAVGLAALLRAGAGAEAGRAVSCLPAPPPPHVVNGRAYLLRCCHARGPLGSHSDLDYLLDFGKSLDMLLIRQGSHMLSSFRRPRAGTV